MREIKFRGKRVDNGEWVYGYFWINTQNKTHWITVSEWNKGGWNIQVIHETVGQYTGLKDKNDVEIYEGDILKIEHGSIVGIVKLVRQVLWDKRELGFSVDLPYWPLSEYVEVIGNIHDNPELMEMGK